MPSLHARNRIVVFRLSQDEYDRLRAACDAVGGRILSAFTRSQTGNADSGIEREFIGIDRKLSASQTLIKHVPDRITALDGDRHHPICRSSVSSTSAFRQGQGNS
jgi:hypothetical protein